MPDYQEALSQDMNKVAELTAKMNNNKFPRTKYETFKDDKCFKKDLGKINKEDKELGECKQ